MKAIRFDDYGDVDVLDVVDVPDPEPADGKVVVRVEAAAINPGEAKIREGAYRDRWPSDFPEGEGSDLAGTVEAVGAGVDGWQPGDEVIGFTDERASHAELVAVDAVHLTRRPPDVPWDVAGSLYVVGSTAWACVRAVGASEGDTVVVAGAAGGVGTLTVQLARNAGATVVGLASEPHHAWLLEHGVVPVSYGDGVAERIRAASGDGVDALIDTVGWGYVDLALDLGVTPERINTIVDFEAAARTGAKTDGNAVGASAEVLGELARLFSEGKLDVPIAGTYPLDRVRDAFRELERGHTLGKIVLHPG
jgi:NADPH:quinone reductase-like Zn-dependent oxidoreductase